MKRLSLLIIWFLVCNTRKINYHIFHDLKFHGWVPLGPSLYSVSPSCRGDTLIHTAHASSSESVPSHAQAPCLVSPFVRNSGSSFSHTYVSGWGLGYSTLLVRPLSDTGSSNVVRQRLGSSCPVQEYPESYSPFTSPESCPSLGFEIRSSSWLGGQESCSCPLGLSSRRDYHPKRIHRGRMRERPGGILIIPGCCWG